MFKWLRKLFKKKKTYVTPPFYPYGKKSRIRVRIPRLRYKQKKPPFPSTFVFEDYVYEQWNQDLIDNYGWTRKEIKQGWRWKKL